MCIRDSIIGHDVMTAQQLKEAIDLYRGVRGCRAAVVKVNTKKTNTGTHKISGISQLNNFQYNTEDGGIIAWKAFRVGEGERISKQELSKMGRPSSDTGVKVVHPSCEPHESNGMLKKTSKRADIGGSSCSHHACYTTSRSGGLSVV